MSRARCCPCSRRSTKTDRQIPTSRWCAFNPERMFCFSYRHAPLTSKVHREGARAVLHRSHAPPSCGARAESARVLYLTSKTPPRVLHNQPMKLCDYSRFQQRKTITSTVKLVLKKREEKKKREKRSNLLKLFQSFLHLLLSLMVTN